MNTKTNDDLLRSLRAARRRMRAQIFLDCLVHFSLIIGCALLLVAAVQRWVLHEGPLESWYWLVSPALALAAAATQALFCRIKLRTVAQLLDRLGATRDRFLTALKFSGTDAPFQRLALRECRAFLAKRNFAGLVPIRLPWETKSLLVPLIALTLLQWEAQLDAMARAQTRDAAQQEVAPTTQQLEQLAAKLEERGEQPRNEQLQKIADQLRSSAERLRVQTNGAEDAAKAALRELSNLEQMIAQMQQPPAGASPDEVKELAKALEKNEATKDAAKSMQAGNLDQAAKDLETAAAKEQSTKEEIEKTLREALDRLSRQRQLSQALQELARQMQQQAGKGAANQAGALALAELLRKMGAQQSQPRPGQQSSEQMLKNLIAALQNMKLGEDQETAGNQRPGQADDQNRKITIQAFGSAKPGDDARSDLGQVPSGQPGSERDQGTTETPFGKRPGEGGENGVAARLKGHLGEGESLSQIFSTAGDASKSKRRYKELYEAMAPSAGDAVLQENIPLGSRFFIKRYFENIRPKE